MSTLSTTMLSWLLTYVVHSTVLLGVARLVSRRVISAAARDVVWKTALVGGIVTATFQVGLDIRPFGSFPLPGREPGSVSAQPARVDGAVVANASEAARRPEATSAPPTADANALETRSGDAGVASTAATRRSFGDVVVTAWAAIGLLLALVYAAHRMILIGRLGDRRLVVEGRLPAMLSSLQDGADPRRVTLTSSATISSPVALGLNEICVPTAVLTDLDEEQQRGLLAHELAHLARRDPVWLDAASLIERVLFIQPLNRLARREMQLAAEFLCDDWAAARIGSGIPLAKCLARVAEWIQASPLGVPVAGMAEQRSLLVTRIARLIDGRVQARSAPRAVLAGGAIVLLAAMVAAAPGVHARNASPGATPPIGRQPANQELHPDGQPPAEADSTVVAALIERLKDHDAGVRRAAASSLGNLKSRRAVLPLIAVLDDKDREVRQAAVRALGELKDPRSIDPMLDLLRDPAMDVRQAALEALDNFENEIPAGPVMRVLTDRNADVREKAAHLLGAIRDRVAVGALSSLLHDPVPAVRAAALGSLADIRDVGAASAVVGALDDEYADVRHAALRAVQELKIPVSEGLLLDRLGDSSADVRQAALEIVRDRPFPAAVKLIEKLLDDPNGDVRVEAVSALGEFSDPIARRALRTALTSRDPKVRARAAEILGERP